MSTDEHWETYGATDPYFGVLTDARFSRPHLDEQARATFFDSGRKRIGDALARLDHLYGVSRRPYHALDFGCGVGRLSLPLAERCERVVGVDVSPSMLREAARNAEGFGCRNVTWVASDDRLSALKDQRFNLVVSDLVFQHIPVARGMRILDALLERLEPDARGVLGFVYGKAHRFAWARGAIRKLPLARRLYNLGWQRKGRPPMQMNAYPLDRLFARLYARGAQQVHLELGQHAGSLTCVLYFERRTRPCRGKTRKSAGLLY